MLPNKLFFITHKTEISIILNLFTCANQNAHIFISLFFLLKLHARIYIYITFRMMVYIITSLYTHFGWCFFFIWFYTRYVISSSSSSFLLSYWNWRFVYMDASIMSYQYFVSIKGWQKKQPAFISFNSRHNTQAKHKKHYVNR